MSKQDDHLFFAGIPSPEPQRRPVGLREAAVAAPSSVHDAFAASEFYGWVLLQAGLDVRQYRQRSLLRRLPACLRFLRVRTIDEARAALQRQPALMQPAVSTLLLGVTAFCRDRVVFDFLQSQVLPDILTREASPRIWSAACSNGEELLSVAILLAEANRLHDVYLLGTDCRADAIQRAQAARYPAESLKGLNRVWQERYFSPEQDQFAAKSLLREAIEWRVANLFTRTEAGPWHLILWRNMSIYLNPAAANLIWTNLDEQLHPGGYVVVGKADHPPPGLKWRRVASAVYRKPEA